MPRYKIADDGTGGFRAAFHRPDGVMESVTGLPSREAALNWVAERLTVGQAGPSDPSGTPASDLPATHVG